MSRDASTSSGVSWLAEEDRVRIGAGAGPLIRGDLGAAALVPAERVVVALGVHARSRRSARGCRTGCRTRPAENPTCCWTRRTASGRRAAAGPAARGLGAEAHAQTTTSHKPSSIAAAARHTMPTEEAPPRSSRSAKFTDQPQYSATVAGLNSDVSPTSLPTQTPSTSRGSMPASASASAASSAHCSSENRGTPVKCRLGVRCA